MNRNIPRWSRWWFQFVFTPTWGNDPIWLYNIFQMGWNHQIDDLGSYGDSPIVERVKSSVLQWGFHTSRHDVEVYDSIHFKPDFWCVKCCSCFQILDHIQLTRFITNGPTWRYTMVQHGSAHFENKHTSSNLAQIHWGFVREKDARHHLWL